MLKKSYTPDNNLEKYINKDKILVLSLLLEYKKLIFSTFQRLFLRKHNSFVTDKYVEILKIKFLV